MKYRNLILIVTLSATLNFNIWSEDVTQAYIQGQDLKRAVYVKPASYFNILINQFLKLLKTLYGLTEYGDKWFQTYNKYLTKTLKTKPTYGDMSF